ncbi:hypothetical protein BDW62DRAFT_63567 [Aspergillus aurantiobrunneus]
MFRGSRCVLLASQSQEEFAHTPSHAESHSKQLSNAQTTLAGLIGYRTHRQLEPFKFKCTTSSLKTQSAARLSSRAPDSGNRVIHAALA